jgi:hypothetical protein
VTIDDDEPQSQTDEQRRERRYYMHHLQFFAAGMGLGFFGMMATRLNALVGAPWAEGRATSACAPQTAAWGGPSSRASSSCSSAQAS